MADKTIKLFIMESKKNLKAVDLSNWIGKVYIGDRKHVEIIQTIPDIAKSTGVYFLLGRDIDSDETFLYIGEADDVAHRIKQHANTKSMEWFEKFIVFVSKDMDLTKAHVRYLEKSFYDLAKENLTTISLQNKCCPPGSNLSDSDIAYMQEFQNNMVLILNNLGLIDFVKTSETETTKSKKNIFYLSLSQDRKDKDGNVAQARMQITENGYLLLKGSYIESVERQSFKTHIYHKIREKLEAEGVFEQSDVKGLLVAKENIPFKACSAAAAVAKNRATNGRSEWKLQDGTTLDEFEKTTV